MSETMTDRSARAEHYRNKADEARILAESMHDTEARRFLMTVVNDYLMLADLLRRLPDPLPASE